MIRCLVLSAILIPAFWLAGCSGPKDPKREPTFAVTGVVQIDGKPTPSVQLFVFSADKAPEVINNLLGAPHMATTDSKGKFQISTFATGDGAPVGNYVIAFYWQGNQMPSALGDPDDPKLDPAATKFNMKYGSPSKSQFKVTVEQGKPVDLKTLELTTK